MTRQQLLDLYYLDARSRLIDIAAFLDRLDRAEGQADFRLAAFNKALDQIAGPAGKRTEGGAWPGKS